MLQMRVYSERSVSMNGITTRTGEDALPYINRAGMFVADGMGGSAGIRVVKFPPDCFDGDRLAERLNSVSPTLDSSVKAELDTYLRDLFSSLTNPTMEQVYENPESNVFRLKKSGYVGSHAVGAVLAAELIRLERVYDNPDYAHHWEETITRIKDDLVEQYRQVINLLGAECAKVNMSKIRYFGTTLSGAFFLEKEDSVDVIFLNCGDSRSYVWDQDGFRQACDDQGRNGGMTSLICLDGETDISISLEKRTYRKPCAIISMTDGIYGTFHGTDGFHSSPLYMEGYLMSTLGEADSLENAQDSLKNMFDLRGNHDDSNSLVMAAFGYADYTELKDAANKRMEYLNTKYLLDSQPDDFLVTDYQKHYQKLEQEYARQLMPILEEAYSLTAIQDYCMQQVHKPPFQQKYCGKIAEIQVAIRELHYKNKDIQDALCRLVEDNFIDFVDVAESSSPFRRFYQGNSVSRAKQSGDDYVWNIEHRDTAITYILRNLENMRTFLDRVRSSAERIRCSANEPWDQNRLEVSKTWVRDVTQDLRKLVMQLNCELDHVSVYSQSISDRKLEWKRENKKIVSQYYSNGGTVRIPDIVDAWLRQDSVEDSLGRTTIPFMRNLIMEKMKTYRENIVAEQELHRKCEEVYKMAAHRYWQDQAAVEIASLLQDEHYFVENPELANRIVEKRNENRELLRWQKLSETQQAVFAEYLDAHLADVRADKKEDVERCGWM